MHFTYAQLTHALTINYMHIISEQKLNEPNLNVPR